MTSFHQLPGTLHGALDVLRGFLSPNQVDNKASSSSSAWRFELPPPSLLQPLVPLSKHSSLVAQAPATTAGVNWSQLSGTWIKDRKASDSMEPVLQLMQMRGLVRQAIKLVKGINIKHKEDAVTIEVFSVIGWFKVVERYSLSGVPACFRRRDLRRGQHQGQIRVFAPPRIENPKATLKPAQDDEQQQQQLGLPGTLTLDLSWGEPHSGSGWDVYELKAEDQLHVHSTVIVGDEAVKTTSVFRKK